MVNSTKLAFCAVSVICVAALATVGGCTSSVSQTSPSPGGLNLPLVRLTSTGDIDSTLQSLTQIWTVNNYTVVQPFTKSTNSYGNTVYTATFQSADKKAAEINVLEVCKDANDRTTRAQQLANDAKAKGYKEVSGHPSDMWVGSYVSGTVAHDISIKLYDNGNQPPEILIMSGDRAF